MSQRASRTASMSDRRCEDTWCATRRGEPELEATSAWTSTRNDREPSLVTVKTTPDTSATSSAQRHRRLGQVAQTLIDHLEQPHLAGGSEAVLDRAHDAQGAVAVTLDAHHRVDEVLEGARTRQLAVLGDVADEDERGASGFGQCAQPLGGVAHLGHRARHALRSSSLIAEIESMTQTWGRRSSMSESAVATDVVVATSSPSGTGPRRRARWATWGADSSAPMSSTDAPVIAKAAQTHQRQRGLTHSGLAEEQRGRTREQPAAEHSVQF